MSGVVVPQLVGFAGFALALAAAAVAITGRRGGGRWRFVGLLAAAVAWVPVGGIPLAGYLRGFFGDLSVTTMLLLVAALIGRVWGGRVLDGPERVALWGWSVAAGLALYPLTLGSTPWDPYQLGFRPRMLLLVVAALVIGLWRRRRGSALVLAAGVAGYDLHILESSNLWDYLVDPALTLWAMGALLARSPTGRRLGAIIRRALGGARLSPLPSGEKAR
jgi:hypothetical protein